MVMMTPTGTRLRKSNAQCWPDGHPSGLHEHARYTRPGKSRLSPKAPEGRVCTSDKCLVSCDAKAARTQQRIWASRRAPALDIASSLQKATRNVLVRCLTSVLIKLLPQCRPRTPPAHVHPNQFLESSLRTTNATNGYSIHSTAQMGQTT